MLNVIAALCALICPDNDHVGQPRYYQMSADERSAKDREQGHCGMPYDNTYAPDQGNAGVGVNHKGEG